MGYTKTAIKGVGWVGALRASTRVAAFIRTLVLGRILVPAQFGLFGIALLVLSLLEIFTETGINLFLLQEKDDVDDYVSTAWVVSILRGALISLVLFLGAPFVSSFFKSPEAVGLLRLTAIVPLLRGFINPSVIKFQVELAFGKDFTFRFLVFIVDVFVAIVAAVVTESAVSVIYGLIAGVILELILSCVLVSPRPRFEFDRVKFLEVIHRGKWMTGAGIFQYLFREGDDIVVGRMLNSSSLGLYQMAYKIATLPISEVADVVGKVTLPIYVRIANEKVRLFRAFFVTTAVVFVVTGPFSLFLYLSSDWIIQTLLGENWLPASSALKYVAIYAFIRALINPALTTFLSVKKQEYVTLVTMVGIVAMALSIFPLVSTYGIAGAGISTIIGVSATLPLVGYYTYKIFH